MNARSWMPCSIIAILMMPIALTFEDPGEHVLRGVASDGSAFTHKNIMVTVTP